MCMLFSPMSQFAGQQTAVATAEAMLRGFVGEERRDSAAEAAAEDGAGPAESSSSK